MDVPLIVSVLVGPPLQQERMSLPGARMSTTLFKVRIRFSKADKFDILGTYTFHDLKNRQARL
jgi:hypothetical protein